MPGSQVGWATILSLSGLGWLEVNASGPKRGRNVTRPSGTREKTGSCGQVSSPVNITRWHDPFELDLPGPDAIEGSFAPEPPFPIPRGLTNLYSHQSQRENWRCGGR